MNLLTIKKEFSDKCLAAYNAEGTVDFALKNQNAFGYCEALFKLLTWEERRDVFAAAQWALGSEVPNCFGIPTMSKSEFEKSQMVAV